MGERLSISQKIDNWVRSGDRSIWDCYARTSKKSFKTQRIVNARRAIPIPRRFDRDQVLLIRSLYEVESFSYRDLAARFETCKATIAHVVKGKGAYKGC